MLFTGPETARLINRLNRRFNDDHIDNIRGNNKRRKRFTEPNRTLARVAYKSGTYPGSNTTDPLAKRWFYFLKNLPAGVQTTIRDQLKSGLIDEHDNGDYKYLSMSFVAFEGPVVHFEYEDVPQVDGTGAETGYYVKIFKLQTMVIGDDEFDPPADTGEVNEPDDPPA